MKYSTHPGFMKKLLLVYCFFFGLASSRAQLDKPLFQNAVVDRTMERRATDIDSIGALLSDSAPDSAIVLTKKAIGMALDAHSPYAYAMALNTIGWAYFKLGDIDSSLRYTSAATAMFHDLKNTKLESSGLMKLSSVYESISDYPKALNYLKESIQLANQNKDSTTMMLAEKMIGTIYLEQGYIEKARLHLENALKAASSPREAKYFGDALSCMAGLYIQIGIYDTAKLFLRRALNEYELQNSGNSMAIVNEDLGVCFDENKEAERYQSLDSALFYYQRAYDINTRLNNAHDAAYEKMLIGQVLIKKRQYGPAEKDILGSLSVFDSLHNTREEFQCLKELSILYDSMHDYKRAYAAMLRSNFYYDTLNKLDKNRAIADMLVKYDANKKDTTIALLNARSELVERKLSRTRIIEVFSFILIALSALLTLVLLNRNNIKQRLRQLQMRNQIASDLHDEVGSSLSSILMLGKMAMADQGGRDEIIPKINSTAEEMIERISDIVWATNPKYDDGKNLQEKISNYIMQVNKLSKLKVSLHFKEEISDIKFQMDVRRNVFLVIKEAINNVLKHADASVIAISMDVELKKLLVQITDNGHGFDIQNHNDGNGLENMRARTESVKGKFGITSGPGKGTSINIVIPL